MKDLTLIVPVYNEEESIPVLMEWIDRALGDSNINYEVLFIDDGSTDNSWESIELLQNQYVSVVRGVKFRRNYGKSAALNQGFKEAKGDVVITMDADLQDSPDEIVSLYHMIKTDGYDMVSGWKKKRYDPASKRIPSKLFNSVARLMSGIQLHDFNCGLKAYRQDLVKDIHVYGDMHRWIPVLAKWAGYTNIGEKVVEHRRRQFGSSKFGAKRLVSGFLDLLSVFFIGKFNKRPMHFFGTWGILFLFSGLFILAYLSVSKIVYSTTGIHDRPLFYFGILVLIVGSQLFLTGFLAELVIASRSREDSYNVEETI